MRLGILGECECRKGVGFAKVVVDNEVLLECRRRVCDKTDRSLLLQRRRG
jgi:hypothetical protein